MKDVWYLVFTPTTPGKKGVPVSWHWSLEKALESAEKGQYIYKIKDYTRSTVMETKVKTAVETVI